MRIEEAEEIVSKTGKDMIKLTLAVSGYNGKLWKYIVLDGSSSEARKRTDQWLGSIYDSFGIESGNGDVYSWEGKSGGAKIRQRPDQNGEMRSEIHYFLQRKKVDELPAWRDSSSSANEPPEDAEESAEFGASITDIPF